MPSKSHRKKHALKFWKSLWVLCCPTRGNSLNSKGKHSQKHPPGPCGDRLLLGCARKKSSTARDTKLLMDVPVCAAWGLQCTSGYLLRTFWVSGYTRELQGDLRAFHSQAEQGKLVLSLLSPLPSRSSKTQQLRPLHPDAGVSRQLRAFSWLQPPSASIPGAFCPTLSISSLKAQNREEWVLVGSTQILLSLQNSPAWKPGENGKQKENKKQTWLSQTHFFYQGSAGSCPLWQAVVPGLLAHVWERNALPHLFFSCLPLSLIPRKWCQVNPTAVVFP